MKLFHKIFLCFVVIFGITFQAAGYLLINYAYGNAVGQQKKIAFQDFQYNRSILQSMLYSNPEFFAEGGSGAAGISRDFTVPAAVYGEDGTDYFSSLAVLPDKYDFKKTEDDRIFFQILGQEGENYILVCDYVRQGGQGVYLVTQTDISPMLHTQKRMIAYFQKIYIAILCTSFPIIFLLTKALTAPIKRVSEAAGRIARGNYSQRIRMEGKDEIGELAVGFNQMARQVEEKVAELSDMARQKEDFAANFAHELKTPMTSVIGYADMLYQRDLPREQVKGAAGYILEEGMRLEALSLKLMDLFVMGKQDFILERMPIREMFKNLRQGIAPMCQKHGAALHMEAGEGSIYADFDLFKTMALNLADNAVKAGSRDLWVIGRQEGEAVKVVIKDNGRGIPPEELGKITEAFYRVDKSRSRKQHGAGLGMALVARIVEIHGARMEIESDGKTGTAVSVAFRLAGGDREDPGI